MKNLQSLLNDYVQNLRSQRIGYEDLLQSPYETNIPQIVSVNLDGIYCIIEFVDNKLYIATDDEKAIPTDTFPAFRELTTILQNSGYKEITFFGCLFAKDNDAYLTRPQLKDILKNRDKKNLNIAIFDILSLNNKEFEVADYQKRFILIENLFSSSDNIYSLILKKGDKNTADFWRTIQESKIDGYVINETPETVNLDLLLFQMVVLSGLSKNKEGNIDGILVSYLVEPRKYVFAGTIKAGLSDEDKESLYDWGIKNKIKETNDYIFIDPDKDPRVAKIYTPELFVAYKPIHTVIKEELLNTNNKVLGASIIGGTFSRWEDFKPDVDKTGLSQIPSYLKASDTVKIAEAYLPSNITNECIAKHGSLSNNNLLQLQSILFKTGRKEDADNISEWLTQDGWKVALNDYGVIVQDDKNVLDWYKPYVINYESRNSAPYWITNKPIEEQEGTYQIRQYPFMSPSSTGRMYPYVDKESPFEKIDEVKWLSTSFKPMIEIIANSGFHGSSCVMLDLPYKLKNFVLLYNYLFIPDELIDWENGGRELEPHITVLYGINTDDMKEVFDLVDDKAIKFALGDIDIFEKDDYEVLKLNVKSDELQQLYDKLKKSLPNEQTYKEYKPHITLAYLKKGSFEKLKGPNYNKPPFDFCEGMSAKGDVILFSTPDDQVSKKHLKKASLNIISYLRKHKDGWHVYSEKGKHLGGPYTKEQALKRLKQIEYFKHKNASEAIGNNYKNFDYKVNNFIDTDPGGMGLLDTQKEPTNYRYIHYDRSLIPPPLLKAVKLYSEGALHVVGSVAKKPVNTVTKSPIVPMTKRPTESEPITTYPNKGVFSTFSSLKTIEIL